MSELKEKFTSRDFWLTVVTFLTSAGTAINGMAEGDDTLVKIGVICSILSVVIYEAIKAVTKIIGTNEEREEHTESDSKEE